MLLERGGRLRGPGPIEILPTEIGKSDLSSLMFRQESFSFLVVYYEGDGLLRRFQGPPDPLPLDADIEPVIFSYDSHC